MKVDPKRTPVLSCLLGERLQTVECVEPVGILLHKTGFTGLVFNIYFMTFSLKKNLFPA